MFDARHADQQSRREPAASGFFIKAQPRGSPRPHVPELIPERPSIILKPAVIKLDEQFHRKTSNAAIVRDEWVGDGLMPRGDSSGPFSARWTRTQ